MTVFRPILFNTEMVRAILEGRKTKTRRLPKFQPEYGEEIRMRKNKEGKLAAWFYCEKPMLNAIIPSPWCGPEQEPPCQPGDVLWVRETWNVNNLREKEPGEFEVGFIYAASEAPPNGFRWVKTSEENYQKYEDGMSWNFSGWRPSIHMPKEAARIFLLVKSVTCERLKNIDGAEAEAEGALVINNPLIRKDKATYDAAGRTCFARVWNDTLSRDQAVRVGWERNPWVFVIEFERVDKPAEWEEYVK